MSQKKVAQSLNKVLADSYALYLKTQNYHWNVEGPNFKPLHEHFGELYAELAAAIDEIAERIRALGEKSPGSFSEFAKLTTIKEANVDLGESAMVKDLCMDQLKLTKTLKAALKLAQSAGDEVSADMLIERIQVHDKAAWMLRSMLPANERAKLAA